MYLQKPTYKYLMVLLSIITCLMATLGHGEGMVLCVGEDGHANVETSTNGVCDPCVVSKSIGAPIMVDTDHGLFCFSKSGGCLDISLSIEMTPQKTSAYSSSLPRLFLSYSHTALSGMHPAIHSPENDAFALNNPPALRTLSACDAFSPALRI